MFFIVTVKQLILDSDDESETTVARKRRSASNTGKCLVTIFTITDFQWLIEEV